MHAAAVRSQVELHIYLSLQLQRLQHHHHQLQQQQLLLHEARGSCGSHSSSIAPVVVGCGCPLEAQWLQTTNAVSAGSSTGHAVHM